ncbi:SDR family NAD(P)-dependent oxidoreductase [Candidatus Dojkabacteria bacterium]|nr:SDR family NAD(P)-dependent oxidoreductase [Candidatus Dojkabacteria bacterium]
MKLKDKIVLITGGSEGLGFSIAKLLLEKGSIVHTIARDKKKLKEASKKLNNPNFHTNQGNVSSFESIELIIKRIGDIDILINNAGIWLEGSLLSNKQDQISKVIDVNIKGVIYVTKLVLPLMIKKNDGFIINISSTSGLVGKGNQVVYVASKYAVTGFTESLKEDLKTTDVKVAGFYPGGMNTKLFENAGNQKDNQQWMNTDEVASAIIFMLENDATMLIDHIVLKKRKNLI